MKPIDSVLQILKDAGAITDPLVGTISGANVYCTSYDASNAYKTFVPQLQRLHQLTSGTIFDPKYGFEIGMVSKVQLANSPQEWFIPMVDFKTASLSLIRELHRDFLSDLTLHIFNTG